MSTMISLASLVLLAVAVSGFQLNVIETARRLGLYSYLTALEETNSADLVADTDAITVFIPSNEAFKNVNSETKNMWRNNPAYYQKLMRSHVVKGRFDYKDLIDEHPYLTYANLTGRFVNYKAYSVDVQVFTGAVIDTKNFNIEASNGVIHVIEQVVGSLEDTDLLGKAVNNSDLSKVVEGVVAAKLEGVLNGTAPLTLFAPTNEAIGKLPNGLWDKLLQNSTAMKSILERHVVKSGTWFSAGLDNNLKLETYNGNLTVTLQGGKVFVNGTQVLAADDAATNGVIHTIDTVILPPNLKEWLEGFQ